MFIRSRITRGTLKYGEQCVGALAANMVTAASVFIVVAGINGHL
ncbi:hypothetical protein CU044_0737 [Streptomyces sp. L-9-10]|nr:hypothetical protein CU044_0737 [Streptomyces sp. L-9-10]